MSRQGMHRDAWLGALMNIGILQALDFGDWPGAAARFEEVLRQAEKDGNAREALQARLYLAQACFARGQVERAEALWRRTLEDSRALKTPEEEWRSLFGLARALRSRGSTAGAKDALRQSVAAIERLRSGIGAASMKSEFLSDKTSVYDELLELQVDAGDLPGAWDTLQSGRALLLKEQLGLLPALALADFQRRLQPGEMALAFRLSRHRTFTFWITPQAAGVRKSDVGEDRVIELAGRLAADVDGAAEEKQELARLLLPQPALDSAATRVWILPDGVLSTVPFDLLTAGDGPLLTRWQIVYLPAASMLRQAVLRDGRTWPWHSSAIIYADPQPAQAHLLPGDERWGPLSGSRREAGDVSAQIPGRVEVLSGAAITSAELIRKAAGVPILHLSTHGAGDVEDGDRSRLLIGDGYLFAGQLKPGQLAGVRLAVLSACETERGQYRKGEVQSLANAFLGSGASATVASLWKVDDAATTLFMTEFYRNLRQGQAVAERCAAPSSASITPADRWLSRAIGRPSLCRAPPICGRRRRGPGAGCSPAEPCSSSVVFSPRRSVGGRDQDRRQRDNGVLRANRRRADLKRRWAGDLQQVRVDGQSGAEQLLGRPKRHSVRTERNGGAGQRQQGG